MNPTKNPNYKSMSKKDLIRTLDQSREAYLEQYVQLQQAIREYGMMYARLVAAIAAAGGEVQFTADDLEVYGEDLSQITVEVESVDEETTRFFIVTPEDDDAEG